MAYRSILRVWSVVFFLLQTLELGAQPRASLQVWYAIRNQVPVYVAPTLSSRRISLLSRGSPVCIVAFRDQFAAVRVVRGAVSGVVEGFVEKFAITRRQIGDRREISVADACFPPPFVAKAPVPPAQPPPAGGAIVAADGSESTRSPLRIVSDSADRAIATAEFRRLALAQESFWAEKGTYASSLDDLNRFFVPNAAVSAELLEATDEGWDARVTVVKTGLSCLFRSRVSDPESMPPNCSTRSSSGDLLDVDRYGTRGK